MTYDEAMNKRIDQLEEQIRRIRSLSRYSSIEVVERLCDEVLEPETRTTADTDAESGSK